MGKSKKCNCECRCKTSNTPLRTSAARIFGRADKLGDVNILPILVNFPPRRVGPRTGFSGYFSDSGLTDQAQSNLGGSWLNPTANGKYGILG